MRPRSRVRTRISPPNRRVMLVAAASENSAKSIKNALLSTTRRARLLADDLGQNTSNALGLLHWTAMSAGDLDVRGAQLLRQHLALAGHG